MASEVQVCNLALLKFGDLIITSLDDATKEARACKGLYPLMRDELLYEHPWNFAMKRVDITGNVLTDDRPFGDDDYAYAYTLPSDCLRVWEIYGSDEEWEIEDGCLLTDQEEDIYLRYIYQCTTTGKFSPSFVNCLATKLGAELAARIAKDTDKRIELLEELEKILLPRAYRLNAIEGNRKKAEGETPLDDQSFTWQTEGR